MRITSSRPIMRAAAFAAAALSAGAVAATSAEIAAAQDAAAPPCTKIAGPGEQSAAGLRAFVLGLASGEVGCLPPGTYGSLSERYPMLTKNPAAGIILRAQDYAKKPTIVGQLLLAGDKITVSGMIFDGPAGCDGPPPEPCLQMAPVVVNGNDDEVNRSEVKDSASHEGIQVGNDLHAPAPIGVRLLRDYVHDNGVKADRSRANIDYGINWAQGSGVIANSVIANNNGWGVQLSPYAKGVRVTLNTIVGHGRSGVLIGDCNPAENRPQLSLVCTTGPTVDLVRDNVVDDNVIANNCTDPSFTKFCRGGVGSFLLSDPGNGNLVTNNLFFHNYSIKRDEACDGRVGCTPQAPRGLTYSRNMNWDPLFAGGGPSAGVARFALRAGSPAIGAGAAPAGRTLALGNDFAGFGRPSPKGTRTDLGAFEQTRKPKCAVPSLKRLRLTEARLALRAFHCRLGAIIGRRSRRARVVAQSPRRGTVRRAGTRVRVTTR